MNQRQTNFYESYTRSNAHYLTDVYSSMSRAKIDAFRHCEEIYHSEVLMHGYDNTGDMRIISHNSQFFSVAWTLETDEAMYLHVITPSNDYLFEVIRYE